MNQSDFILQAKSGRAFSGDARYISNGQKKSVILFVHGFKGFKDWGHFNLMANFFAENGYVFVKFNFSHNGTTPEHPVDFVDLEAFGNNNFSHELNDIETVLDAITASELKIPAEEIDSENIILMGHSRGGGVSFLKAAEDVRIKKLITLAAIHDLEKRWPQSFIEEWKQKGVTYIHNGRTKQDMPLFYQIVEDFYSNKTRFNIPNAIKNLSIPLFVAHGTTDETLEVSMAHEIASWNENVELMIVEEANHVFGGAHPYPSKELPIHTSQVLKRALQFLIS